MAGGRRRSPARRIAVRPALVVLAAGCVFLSLALPAATASRHARSAAGSATVRSRGAASRVIPAAPVIPPVIWAAQTGIGICQCIADHDRRNINCLGSADACKATCGDHYSFVPNAPSCPLTAQVGGQ